MGDFTNDSAFKDEDIEEGFVAAIPDEDLDDEDDKEDEEDEDEVDAIVDEDVD